MLTRLAFLRIAAAILPLVALPQGAPAQRLSPVAVRYAVHDPARSATPGDTGLVAARAPSDTGRVLEPLSRSDRVLAGVAIGGIGGAVLGWGIGTALNSGNPNREDDIARALFMGLGSAIGIITGIVVGANKGP